FVFSFQRVLTPKLGAEYSYMLFPIKNAEAFHTGKLMRFADVGVEALDDATLRISLERPTSYLPALAAHNTWMPVHRATIEKARAFDDRNATWVRPEIFVSNGPFILQEWRPNARIVVAKNPHH